MESLLRFIFRAFLHREIINYTKPPRYERALFRFNYSSGLHYSSNKSDSRDAVRRAFRTRVVYQIVNGDFWKSKRASINQHGTTLRVTEGFPIIISNEINEIHRNTLDFRSSVTRSSGRVNLPSPPSPQTINLSIALKSHIQFAI